MTSPIETYADWTPEMVRNRLSEVSLNGGFPCVNEDGKCLYRGKNGRKCAMGLFIPDHAYNPIWDVGVYGSDTLFPLMKQWLPRWSDITFWSDVQASHDIRRGKWNHEAFMKDVDEAISECQYRNQPHAEVLEAVKKAGI